MEILVQTRSFLAGLAAFFLAAAPADVEARSPGWTRAFASSLWPAPSGQEVQVTGATVRSAVRVGAGGKQIRLRLANDYGGDVVIAAASVRLRGGMAVPVTVGGQQTFTVRGGAPLVSDPVALLVRPFDVIEVSYFIPGRATLPSVHENSAEPTAISAPGDFTRGDFVPAATSRLRPLLAGIDVDTGKPQPVIVALGDSITDNGSCALAAIPVCRWSEVLGRRLVQSRRKHVVINQAISGNRVITDGFGPSALARFDRDVLAVPGVSHVVLLEGINDVGNSGLTRNGTTRPVITAADLIEGYRQLILRAREKRIKVIAMTILPFEGAFYYSPEREAIRREVNTWLRTAGAFDAVIDMERVVADPANPARLNPALQGGDNLHPDGRGETAMGEAIDLKLFRR